MKKSFLLLAAILILAVFVTCNADKATERLLYGKWENIDGLNREIMEFKSNNVMIKSYYQADEYLFSVSCNYAVSGDKLVVSKDGVSTSVPFSLDGNKLTVDERTYTRM